MISIAKKEFLSLIKSIKAIVIIIIFVFFSYYLSVFKYKIFGFYFGISICINPVTQYN